MLNTITTFLLSNKYCLIGLLIVIAILVLMIFIGCFDHIGFETSKFGPSDLLYVHYQGSYRNIGCIHQENQKKKEKYFKISNNFGIYYDSPKTIQNDKKCRAIAGILVNSGEQFKIQDFLRDNPEFTHTNVPAVKAVIGTPFKLRIGISFFVYVIKNFNFCRKKERNFYFNGEENPVIMYILHHFLIYIY